MLVPCTSHILPWIVAQSSMSFDHFNPCSCHPSCSLVLVTVYLAIFLAASSYCTDILLPLQLPNTSCELALVVTKSWFLFSSFFVSFAICCTVPAQLELLSNHFQLSQLLNPSCSLQRQLAGTSTPQESNMWWMYYHFQPSQLLWVVASPGCCLKSFLLSACCVQ